MSRFRKLFWVGVVLLLLSAFWVVPLVKEAVEMDVDGPAQAIDGMTQSFEFSGSPVLRFVDLNGSISLSRAEREEEEEQISVTVTRKARGADQNQAKSELGKVSVEFKKTKEGFDIHSTTGTGPLKRPSSSKRIDFRIVAPEGTGITVTNGRGSVTLKGVRGNVTLEGPDLAVDLNDVRGRVSVQVGKGDVRVGNASGEVRLETREGLISLNKASGLALNAAASKDVTVKDGGAGSELRIVSTGGNVTLDRSRGNTVSVESKGGQINVSETTADTSLTASAKSGSISFKRVNAGQFRAHTGSGDLDLTDVQGSFDLKTDKGSVTVWRATAQGLKIRGTADAAFFGELPKEGEGNIEVASGNIYVYVSKESAFSLDARTGSGKIAIDRSLRLDTQDGEGNSHIRGVANGGSFPFGLTTGAGNITISTGGPPAYFTPGGAR